MSEPIKTEVVETTEETTPDESSPENKSKEQTQSDEGDQNSDENKDVPFHQHPRWKQREEEWNKKMEERDRQWEERFSTLKSELTPPKPKDESVKIPEWFGGDENQWRAYQADQAKIIADAEERAFQRLQSTTSKESEAVKAANDWFEQSVKGIETETGETVDRNALLETVLKHELIDSKGRWNYRAGFEILRAQSGTTKAKDSNLKDRKKLANATTDGDKGGEGTKFAGKTSEDFQKERPW